MLSDTLFSRSALMIVGVVGVSSLAIAAPSYAASINFATWTPSGNVTTGIGSATLVTNPNSTSALDSTLQNFLGVSPDALDDGFDQAYQGSALKSFFNAGDSISFDYNFAAFGSDLDYAFVVRNGAVERLLFPAGGTYTATFTTAGLFGIGTVDVIDGNEASTLSITNASAATAAVPTPALLPGLIGVGVSMLRKRKQAV
jgi:hypothetical protein